MGDDSPQSLLAGYQENGRRWNYSNGPLLASENKVSTRRWKEISKRRPRMILMKRRHRLQAAGSTRPAANVFEKRVRVLRKLVPTQESEGTGLDGLFRDTTDYILALEMRVKVMQIMVKALSGGSDI